MKKVTFILLFVLFSSAMAQPCTYKDVLSKMTLFYDKTYPSKIDIQKADFSSIILNQSTDYLGAIGVHKKRLVVLISSAKRNPQNPLVYEITQANQKIPQMISTQKIVVCRRKAWLWAISFWTNMKTSQPLGYSRAKYSYGGFSPKRER